MSSEPFFWLLHWMSRTMLWLYYPGMDTENAEYANHTGPMLLCGNHPNTLMDPLMAGIHLNHRLYFLANAGLWLNPVAAFIIDPFCVPVARPKDKEAGASTGGREEVFKRTFGALEAGRLVYIAPEAYSELERKLRRIKAGAAGIALEAEARNDWKLGLTLQPVGINYESPTTPFSRALVRYGPPIHAADWRAHYEKSPMRAVRALTNHLAERMRDLLIQTEHKDEERCLRRIERSVQHDRPEGVRAHHYRTQNLLGWLRGLGEEERGRVCRLAAAYDAALRERGVADLALSHHPAGRQFRIEVVAWLPVFLYGLLNHLPWMLAMRTLYRTSGADRGYKATMQTLGSYLTLPLCYGVQAWLFATIVGGGWGWYLLSLVPAGILALRYWLRYRPFWAVRLHGGRHRRGELGRMRRELMDAVEELGAPVYV